MIKTALTHPDHSILGTFVRSRLLARSYYCASDTFGRGLLLVSIRDYAERVHVGSFDLNANYEPVRPMSPAGTAHLAAVIVNHLRMELPLAQRCATHGCHLEAEERLSLGIYAGRYCDFHYETAFPLRKEGKAGYDFLDAGEAYDED